MEVVQLSSIPGTTYLCNVLSALYESIQETILCTQQTIKFVKRQQVPIYHCLFFTALTIVSHCSRAPKHITIESEYYIKTYRRSTLGLVSNRACNETYDVSPSDVPATNTGHLLHVTLHATRCDIVSLSADYCDGKIPDMLLFSRVPRISEKGSI